MIYYRAAITNGVVLLPLIALLPLVPYYWKHRRRGVNNPVRLLVFYSFVLYAMITWYFVALPLPSEEYLAGIPPAGQNWIPFSYFRNLQGSTGFDIMQGSTWFSAVGSSFALQYWFNVLMLVPLGMYLRYIFRLGAGKTALVVLATTVFFEASQLTGMFGIFSKPYRSFDVDDILCNFIGGVLGYWIMGKLGKVAARVEARAAEAFRGGKGVAVMRRVLAFAIDVQLVYVINLGLKQIPGLWIVRSDLYATALFLAELLLYTVLCMLLLRGRTVGKWLMRFFICASAGGRARPGQLLARYAMLYGVLILLALAPAMAKLAGLPEDAVALMSRVLLLLGAAAGLFHVVAAWMFPLRDYPWGVLSRTRVENDPRHHRQAAAA